MSRIYLYSDKNISRLTDSCYFDKFKWNVKYLVVRFDWDPTRPKNKGSKVNFFWDPSQDMSSRNRPLIGRQLDRSVNLRPCLFICSFFLAGNYFKLCSCLRSQKKLTLETSKFVKKKQSLMVYKRHTHKQKHISIWWHSN